MRVSKLWMYDVLMSLMGPEMVRNILICCQQVRMQIALKISGERMGFPCGRQTHYVRLADLQLRPKMFTPKIKVPILIRFFLHPSTISDGTKKSFSKLLPIHFHNECRSSIRRNRLE